MILFLGKNEKQFKTSGQKEAVGQKIKKKKVVFGREIGLVSTGTSFGKITGATL